MFMYVCVFFNVCVCACARVLVCICLSVSVCLHQFHSVSLSDTVCFCQTISDSLATFVKVGELNEYVI